MNEPSSINNMFKAYLFILLNYAIAFLISILVGIVFRFLHPLLMILIADLVATIVIFIGSTIVKNISVYDPYWSITPSIIALYHLLFPQLTNPNSFRFIIVSILVFLYSVRLTYNWLRSWQGLNHEDWRYTMYREKMGKKFWLINLAGLQVMPTIQVYLGSISLFPAISLRTKSFGLVDILALVITGGAILLEAVADQQLHKFVKNRESKEEVITTGLWAYSRHPNYLGEILFWWGLYLFALASDISFFWAIIGPICITILFIFLSIPMMERRNLERKPTYAQYRYQVSMLIPWFRKKK
ncbi:MAG: DUF1295 domain-containing protein [Candidatus Thorarchaeota archaeon]